MKYCRSRLARGMKTIPFRMLNTNLVVSGGLAEPCTAVATARNGATTILIQDHPGLEGSSSGEIRILDRRNLRNSENDNSVQTGGNYRRTSVPQPLSESGFLPDKLEPHHVPVCQSRAESVPVPEYLDPEPEERRKSD